MNISDIINNGEIIVFNFESNLKKLRAKHGFNQKDLAQQLNVTQQTVSSWERGVFPDVFMLSNIAKLFDVTIDKLLFLLKEDDPREKTYFRNDLLPQLTNEEREQLNFMVEFMIERRNRKK